MRMKKTARIMIVYLTRNPLRAPGVTVMGETRG